MDDLVQFLRARLDEDEKVARRVSGSWREIGDTGVIATSDGQHAEECANGNWTGIADHIVRHDPARVLREVDAKRRALSEYDEAFAQRKELAGTPHSIEGSVRLLTALRFVKLLALPYADHPDYRDEWRP